MITILNRALDLLAFENYISGFDFGSFSPNRLVIHHTWRPTAAQWKGETSLLGLKSYYERKGWRAGPHLFIADDGIWLFTPMNQQGVHAGTLNPRSIGIEVVGDYNDQPWSGVTKLLALGAIKLLMNRLKLSESQLYFHRDVSPKTCPGTAITKDWLFEALRRFELPISQSSVLQEHDENLHADPKADFPDGTFDPQVAISVPDWAKEAVAFVTKAKLFQIQSKEDLRDAVKFYRFYRLLHP
ncbi:N-acetylmuramoyl-L-alanine amidase [Candidatus Peregrinibacteria bacterium]|nr:MAG: N-acetylmuramoyl-L-alanine amidase [Candidatus Peregrinibacteria bacterium]